MKARKKLSSLKVKKTYPKKEKPVNYKKLALEFLTFTDSSIKIRYLVQKIWDLVEKDKKIANKFLKLFEQIESCKALISKDYSIQFSQLKENFSFVKLKDAPEFLSPVIAALYLQAKELVKIVNPIKFTDKTINKSLDKLIGYAKNIDSPFIGELLISTVKEAKRSKDFELVLSNGAIEYQNLVEEFYGHDGTNRPEPLKQNCECRSGHIDEYGTEQSAETTCWAIAVAVAIIVIGIILIAL